MTPLNKDECGVGDVRVAYKRFVDAARKDKRLAVLFLVDPLRAFADAGIELSKAARKRLRDVVPRDVANAKVLYGEIKAGQRSLYFKCVAVAKHRT